MDYLRIALLIIVPALIFFGFFYLIPYFRRSKGKLESAWKNQNQRIYNLKNFTHKHEDTLYSPKTICKIKELEKDISEIEENQKKLEQDGEKFVQEFRQKDAKKISHYVDDSGMHTVTEECNKEWTCSELESKFIRDKEKYALELSKFRYGEVLLDSIYGFLFEDMCKEILKQYFSLCDLTIRLRAKRDFAEVQQRIGYFLDALNIPKMGVYRDKLRAYKEVIIR